MLLFKIIILILILNTFFFGQETNQNFLNTIWICEVTSEANDSLYLNLDLSFINYNCEIDEHTYGTFDIYKDTLYLSQEFGEFDSTFKEGSIHRRRKAIYKYLILDQDNIKLVYYKENNALQGILEFECEYILKKVK